MLEEYLAIFNYLPVSWADIVAIGWLDDGAAMVIWEGSRRIN
jgi:1,2-phenylacetyl-CoA epoxidase catalytic subunit